MDTIEVDTLNIQKIINPLFWSIACGIIALVVVGFVIYVYLKRKQRKKLVIIPEKEKNEEEPAVFENETISITEHEEFSRPKFTPPDDLPHSNYSPKTKEIKVNKIVSHADIKQPFPIRIGYEPSNAFEQQKPYQYAVAKMPLKNSLVKIPRKGYAYNKGITEDNFYELLNKYFGKSFNVYNDRFVPKRNSKPYEPDFVLSCEKDSKNIFIDIEIDEPYDIRDRKPIHCIGEDDARDDFFTKRGWIVIRFAEKQVHQEPRKCCSFVAKVILSVDKTFYSELLNESNPFNMPQWDTVQSEKWAKEKYREEYLDIDVANFYSNIKEVCEYKIVESNADNEVEEYVLKLNEVKPVVLVVTPTPPKINIKSNYTPQTIYTPPHPTYPSRNVKIYKPDSLFDFGKYKGQKLIDVYKHNPSYIDWCKDNVQSFHISSEDLSSMDSLFPRKRNTSSGCMVAIMFILLFNILLTVWIIN